MISLVQYKGGSYREQGKNSILSQDLTANFNCSLKREGGMLIKVKWPVGIWHLFINQLLLSRKQDNKGRMGHMLVHKEKKGLGQINVEKRRTH